MFKSNQIRFICQKFSTQYNNEFALRFAGQTGDNFALTSAHVVAVFFESLLIRIFIIYILP